MKEKAQHIIKSQRFELTLDDKTRAHEYQSRISTLQQISITKILEEVLDTYTSKEFLYQFDEVVLDVGSISPANFEKELAYKIEEALTDFFKHTVLQNGRLRIGKQERIHNIQLEAFEFFLQNGYLNWQTPTTDKPREILKELLKSNPKDVVTILKNEGKKEHIRKRLITQLNDDFLEEIVISVADTDANYMNSYRRNMINEQKKHKLVEANTDHFRNATWEIVLAYLFLETASRYTKKNFLKYLIQKVARKYRLTYHKLLKAVLIGIQTKENRGVEFQKLVIELDEDEEKRKPTIFNAKNKQDKDIGLIVLLAHYLEHSSLPIEANFNSITSFYKALEKYIVTTDKLPIEVEAILSDKNKTKLLLINVPESLLQLMITKSTQEELTTLNKLANRLKEIQKTQKITSKIVSKLSDKLGEIIIRTHYQNKITTAHYIEEFLYQIMKAFPLDQGFVDVLNILKTTEEKKVSSKIEAFLEQITIPQEIKYKEEKDDKKESLGRKLLNKYAKNNIDYSFEQEIKDQKISEEALKLMNVLFELSVRATNLSVQEIVIWLKDRIAELNQKGKNASELIQELYLITNYLKTKKEIAVAIQELKNEYKVTQDANQINIDAKTAKVNVNKILEEIQLTWYKRVDSSTLLEEIKKIFKKTATTSKVTIEVLKKEVEKFLLQKEEYNLVQKIVSEIDFNKKQNKTIPQKHTLQYAVDLVTYFAINGMLPWWAEKMNKERFSNEIRKVVEAFSEQFKALLKEENQRRRLVLQMNEETFEIVFGLYTSSKMNSFFQVKKASFILIQEELSMLQKIPSNFIDEIHLELLTYLRQIGTVDLNKLIRFLIKKIATATKQSTLDIQLLLIDKVNKVVGEVESKKLKQSLGSKIISETNSKKDVILDRIITKKKSWESIIAFPSKNETFQKLKENYLQEKQKVFTLLRRDNNRKKLIAQLNPNEQLESVTLFLSNKMSNSWSLVKLFLEEIKKQLTRTQYQNYQEQLVSALWYKIAMDTQLNWNLDEWGRILMRSFIPLEGKIIVEDVIAGHNLFTQKTEVIELVKEVKKKYKEIKAIEKKKETLDEKLITEIEELEEEVGTSIYIKNAGMVILIPYISMLFDRAGLLENKSLKDDESIHKAIYLLEYAVTGKTLLQEQDLVLNKIICGVNLQYPITLNVTLSQADKDLVDGLLKAITAQWSALKNTSIDGLRGSFLYREGKIMIEDESYILTVEQKSFDMLLDKIPWNINQLKLSWMQKLLEVIWR